MYVWNTNGLTPEGYNLNQDQVAEGREGYPLRPELVESLWYLYQATGDPEWLEYGADILHNIQLLTKTKCGYARVKDVRSMKLQDGMDSFLLSETLKYLYLLFDVENFVNKKSSFIFSTEAHLFDIDVMMELKYPSTPLTSTTAFCPNETYADLISNGGFSFGFPLPKSADIVSVQSSVPIVGNNVIGTNTVIDLNQIQNLQNLDLNTVQSIQYNPNLAKNPEELNKLIRSALGGIELKDVKILQQIAQNNEQNKKEDAQQERDSQNKENHEESVVPPESSAITLVEDENQK